MTTNLNNLKIDFNKISSVHFFKSTESSPIETPLTLEKESINEQLSPLKRKALMFYSRLGGINDFSNSPKDLQQISKPQLLSKIDIVNTYKVKKLQNGIQKEQKYEAVTSSNSQFKLNFGYKSKETQKSSIDNESLTQSLMLDLRKPSQFFQQQQQQATPQQQNNISTNMASSVKISGEPDLENKRSGKKHSSLKYLPQTSIKLQNNIVDRIDKDKDAYQQELTQNLVISNSNKPNNGNYQNDNNMDHNIDDNSLNNGLSIFKNEFIQKVASITSLQSPVASSRASASAVFLSQNSKQQQNELVSFQDYVQNQLKRKSHESLDKSINQVPKNRTIQNQSSLIQSLNSNVLTTNQQRVHFSNSERKNQHPLIQKHNSQQNTKQMENIKQLNHIISPLSSPTATQSQLNKHVQKQQQVVITINDLNSRIVGCQTDFENSNKKKSSPSSISPLRKEKGQSSPKSPLESPGIPVRLNNMSFEKRFKLLQMNTQFYPQAAHKAGVSLSPKRSRNYNQNLNQAETHTPKVINDREQKKNNILYSQLNSIKAKRNQQATIENEDTEQTQIIQHVYPDIQNLQKPQIQLENLTQKIKNSSMTSIQSIIKKEINRISDIIPQSYENMIKDSIEDSTTINIIPPQNNLIKEVQSPTQSKEKVKAQIETNNKNDNTKLNLMQQVNLFQEQMNNGLSPLNKVPLTQTNKSDQNQNEGQLNQEHGDSPSRKILQQQQIQNVGQRYSIRDSFQQRSFSQIQQQTNRYSFTHANSSSILNTPQQLQDIKSENSFNDFILKNSTQKSVIMSNNNITPKNQDPEKNKKILKCLFLKNPQNSPFKSIQKQRKPNILSQNNLDQN